MKIKFKNLLILALMSIITASYVSALELISPENIEYSTNKIPLEITSNDTFDNISYILNNTEILLCENCSSHNSTLDLEAGNYTLAVIGKLDNETQTENVSFSVIQPITPIDFDIEIISPLNITYNITDIDVTIVSNKTLDLINLSIDNKSFELLCENCSFHNTSLEFEEGNHSIRAIGQLENIAKEVKTDFTIKLPGNQTNETDNDANQTDENVPRFSLGYNKLPQAVVNNELNDDELAEIIRTNALNPGIINRLIKTGKLGNESIQAILDTQFNPPGILKKILGFIGFKQKTYSELIYENYGLAQKATQKLLVRDDFPAKYADEIKKELKANLEYKIANKTTDNKLKSGKSEINPIKSNNEDKNGKQVASKIDKETKQITKKDKKVYNAGKQNSKGLVKGKSKSSKGKKSGKNS